MYLKGNHNPEQIVVNTNKYPLEGKADVVFQNEGETVATIGVRVLEAGATYRMSGEHTILSNAPVKISFSGVGKNDLWVHFIQPILADCSI